MRRSLLLLVAGPCLILASVATAATTLTFQQGVGGYTGTIDTYVRGAAVDTGYGTDVVVQWDGDDVGGQNIGLLRFDNLFGGGAGQIPTGSIITSAVLTYTVTNVGNTATVNEMAVDWAGTVTWNALGGDAGLQSDEYGAQIGTATGAALAETTLDVTASLVGWSTGASVNRGWVFRPTGGNDGVQFASSAATTVASRPKLTVSYTTVTGVELSPDTIAAVSGATDALMTVAIPAGSNAAGPVHVILVTSDPGVADPMGSAAGALTLTFATGAVTQQTVAIHIGTPGSATLSTSNDAGLTNDSTSVSIDVPSVSFLPSSRAVASVGLAMPLQVWLSPGANATRAVHVTLASTNPAVAVPAGAVGGSLMLTFPAGGASVQTVQLTVGSAGRAEIISSNDAGLYDTRVAITAAAGFDFTATADPRTQSARFDATLVAINSAGGPGAFHVSPGDIDPLQPLRDVIDARFGPAALWFPGVGNHEVETPADMTWVRAEYMTGSGVRTPLRNYTFQDGPAGTIETTYSWDQGNAHFVMLNEYWNGGTAAGSDVARDGDIVPQLYAWLASNLAATNKPVLFVFGHEPAFPENRHVGDSLDLYPANRDAFWDLLEARGVRAYICGHTHYYSRYQGTPNRTWQVDLGNAGNDAPPLDGQTFLKTTVTSAGVRYDIWRNVTGPWLLAESWSEPLVRPDFDIDGDVDQEDFGHLQACFSGTAPQDDPSCTDAKLDRDQDVDAADVATLVNCLQGEGTTADPTCDD